jgi:hypothetical protein
MGDSHFTKEQLAHQIVKKDNEIKLLQEKLDVVRATLKAEESKINDLQVLQQYIPEWSSVWANSSSAQKKMMLSLFINSIAVSVDAIVIEFGIFADEFRRWSTETERVIE